MEETRPKGPGEGTALEEISRDPSSRKRFLKLMGGTAGASALAVLVAACGSDDEQQTTGAGETGATDTGATQADTGDVEIVNYALTLEHLENDFYKQVLDSDLKLPKPAVEAAKSIQENEQEHVDALTATVEQLGGKPAPAPKTKFEDLLAGSPQKVLMTAADVENLGAAAYLGQAAKIKSPDILAAALSIHTVEARHAAALNQLVGRPFKTGKPLEGSLPDGAFAKPMTMEQVLEQVKPFIAS